jgi:hypothetical protein
MADAPLPDLILYGRAGCGLCAEARELILALLADRERSGLPAPTLVDRDIDANEDWQRAFFTTIPVVELGEQRLETLLTLASLKRLLSDAIDAQPAST